MRHLLFWAGIAAIGLPPIHAASQFELACQNADCITLLDSTFVNVSDNGSGTFSIHRRFKIGTLRGAVSSRILKYDYDPLTAFARFKKVIIHRSTQKADTVDVRTTCDYAAPARSIYWGARQIMIGLGQLNPGDEVEYEIEKKGFTYALLGNEEDRFIPPMRGNFYDIVPFWVSEPTVKKVYQVAFPRNKEVQYQFYQGTCYSSARIAGEKRIYTFSIEKALPFERESNMVDLYDVAPKLMMSTTPSWKDKSLWFNKVNEDYGSFAPIPEAQKKVNELIRGKHTEIEKIAILTHWVADNIRYAGLTMGKGEGYTLHNLQMNYTDRAGVCKDIAGTLIAFLRMAGFEAYPAMTMAGSRVEDIPADHFNHCVAVVKLSDGTYMPLDPTWVPFCRELWSSAEQQQNYLPGIPEGSDLCITPVSAPENHYFRIAAENQLDEDGTLKGSFVLTAEGQSDLSVRRLFTTGWQSDWQSSLEKELLAVSPRARLLKVDYGNNPKDYQAGPIRLVFHYEIPQYALRAGNKLVFKPLTMNNLYNRVRSYIYIDDDMEHRQYGFKDACSRLVELNETIQMPKGYHMRGSSIQNKEDSKSASFTGSLHATEKEIIIKQKLTLNKRVYEASDWDGFRAAVKAHKAYAAPIIIEP